MTAHNLIDRIRQVEGVVRTGLVSRIMPGWVEADGPNVPVGTICRLGPAPGVLCEVIRVDRAGIALAPFSDVSALSVGARVEALDAGGRLPAGMAFLGRAVDALAAPIDGGAAVAADVHLPLNPDPPLPLARETPDAILETGIRTIDALHPIGRGQRLGIFAASGVGKTSLLSQLLRQVQADVCVVCLVGERWREVEAIWNSELDAETRKRTALVAATSDQAAALRVRAVAQAIALARYWRDAGLSVFFVLDSITRLAMALREKGLAAGEPPTVRAYTPSVFSAIPRIVEQFGALKSGGCVTAMMTVLSETDDIDDPLSELMKSLLDGHFILSRTLSERGHFPAIDPLKSVSRNAHRLMERGHRESAQRAQALIARYEEARPLIESGLYIAGSNADTDAAIAANPALDNFMRQTLEESEPLRDTVRALETITRGQHG